MAERNPTNAFLHALRRVESGGNYRAYNASSGASGAYQFIFGTWQYALRLAGLRNTTYYHHAARHAPHIVQDVSARALVNHYLREFNHSYFAVAEAWYGGPGAVGHPLRGGGPGYPTVGQYAQRVTTLQREFTGGRVVRHAIHHAPAHRSGHLHSVRAAWRHSHWVYRHRVPHLYHSIRRAMHWH